MLTYYFHQTLQNLVLTYEFKTVYLLLNSMLIRNETVLEK